MLQARQQPCTSVFRHPQTSTAILLPSDRMDPLRSCFRMDGQPKDLGRCHERDIRTILYVDDLLVDSGNHQEAFMGREIITKTLTDSGISRSPTKGHWEPPLKFFSITSATPSHRKGLTAMCHRQSDVAATYFELPNTCYGWQQTTSA